MATEDLNVRAVGKMSAQLCRFLLTSGADTLHYRAVANVFY